MGNINDHRSRRADEVGRKKKRKENHAELKRVMRTMRVNSGEEKRRVEGSGEELDSLRKGAC